jgi:hypothetical protein
MKPIVASASMLLVLCAVSIRGQSTGPDLKPADNLFSAGKFAQAEKLYTRVATYQPANLASQLQIGRIALLENHLDLAEARLKKALTLNPANADGKIMLAEVLYRRDNFGAAAKAMAGLSPSDSQKLANFSVLNPAKLESFEGKTPYELQAQGESTSVKFVVREPLPLVKVKINGGKEVVFFIDTGGAELALDTAFARELGIPQFGDVQGTFSGGQHAAVGNGRIDSVAVGSWVVKNVPVQILALRQLSKPLGTQEIDGVIGTVFLSHFLSTLDFRNGELILRRKTDQATSKGVQVPFWLAGDHFIVGWGNVNKLPPALFFVDTGVAGAGAKLAPSVIQQAGIKLDQKLASAGAGGGGSFTTVPYKIPELSFGDIHQTNVSGVYDGPFPWEHSLGFYIAGDIGHDFVQPYAVTLDFARMLLIFNQ